IAKRLHAIHRRCKPAKSEILTMQNRLVRSAAISLLELGARRAYAIDPSGAESVFKLYVGALRREPFAEMYHFYLDRYNALVDENALPLDHGLRHKVDAAPFAGFLADGIITVHVVCDNSGTPIADVIDFFNEEGFESAEQDDGAVEFSKTVAWKGRSEPVVVHVTVESPEEDQNLYKRLSENDKPPVDIFISSGHASYGRRVQQAAKGLNGPTDSGNLLMILLECWGVGNLETLRSAFEGAQVITTKFETTDELDFVMLKNFFDKIVEEPSWEEFERLNDKSLLYQFRDNPAYKDVDLKTHYVLPHHRAAIAERTNRDDDGKADSLDDNFFNVILPKRVGGAAGYNPVQQVVSLAMLEGTALTSAVDAIRKVFLYETFLPKAMRDKLPWSQDLVFADGYFEPDRDDLRAFRFVYDKKNRKLLIQQSALFAHTDAEDLSRMLAWELGVWMGQQVNLESSKSTGLALST
ncbi:MAG: hypothetical protein R3C68_19585, partial [Myxococcota bacterium]